MSEEYALLDIVSVNDIDWSRSNNVVSKAKSPVRITFAGGGTDLTSYPGVSSGRPIILATQTETLEWVDKNLPQFRKMSWDYLHKQ